MRVALVCPYDIGVPGGVQAHVRSLAETLRGGGDDVLVVAPCEGEPPPGVVAAGGSVRVRFNRSVAPIAWSPFAAREAIRAVRRFEPHVLHIHEPAVPVLSLALALRGPRPIVATFHAWSDEDRAYGAAGPVLRQLLRRIAERIAVSPPAATYHAGALGLDPESFRIVPNGVDVARFRDARPLGEDPAAEGPAGEEPAAEGPTLLFVGRLEPRKGLIHLVRALPRLRAGHPSLRLVVVGAGPEEQRCRDALPPEHRRGVEFVGSVDPEDLPRFHASADLFVSPALGGESFGIVLLEAMSAGLPVVATSIPGYRSVVDDGRTGLLVPPGDEDALAGALDALLSDPERAGRIAQEARGTADAHDWSRVAARIRDVYADVLGGTR